MPLAGGRSEGRQQNNRCRGFVQPNRGPQHDTGIETPEDVEIVSGVKEGDLVVAGDRSGSEGRPKGTPKIVSVMEYQEQQ